MLCSCGNNKVYQVQSCISGEGKTTVSTNLARALGESQRKTLIIDCDFSKPSIHRIFNLHRETGITDYFKGEKILVDKVLNNPKLLYVIFNNEKYFSIKESFCKTAKLLYNTEIIFNENKFDLNNIYDSFKNELKLLGEFSDDDTKNSDINLKPRLRMLTLYGVAQSFGYLVIGTGNLCERMVGYTTKWGDGASDFNPIANITVEEVLKIGEYLGVPDKIINKSLMFLHK